MDEADKKELNSVENYSEAEVRAVKTLLSRGDLSGPPESEEQLSTVTQ